MCGVRSLLVASGALQVFLLLDIYGSPGRNRIASQPFRVAGLNAQDSRFDTTERFVIRNSRRRANVRHDSGLSIGDVGQERRATKGGEKVNFFKDGPNRPEYRWEKRQVAVAGL